MIVFLRFPVKTKPRKPQLGQALRSIAARSYSVLVLASSSQYRHALLARLKLPFTVASPEVDESPLDGETPPATALRLAQSKARAVAAHYPRAHIIGSDQVAELDGKALGKPGSRDAALAQLAAMRGRSVVFHTAVCLIDGLSAQLQIEDVPTTVHFRHYSDAQAGRYLEIDKPYDCAGSAKIEALGISLVERIDSSDPTALIGLPLIALVTMLKRVGIEVL
jgi:septum formation protein